MAFVEQLFSENICIRFRTTALEDRRQSVTVDVELRSTGSKRELYIRLTDDQDLFFLYTLALGEDDFQTLKTQQDLLVDFGAFPQKLIDLLHLCSAEEGKPTPKFVTEFVTAPRGATCGPVSAQLKIIETNPFKNLEHLTLKLVHGTDSDVKKHLAEKLKGLSEKLNVESKAHGRREAELKTRLEAAEDSLAEKTRQLDDLRIASTTERNTLTSTLQKDLLAEREKLAVLRDESNRKWEAERKSVEMERVQEKKQSEARVTNLEAANRELTDRRYSNEATIRELKTKLNLLEEEHGRVKQDLQNQRKSSSALDSELRIKEKEHATLQNKLGRLEEEIKDKEKVLQRSADLLEGEKGKTARLSERSRQQVQKRKSWKSM